MVMSITSAVVAGILLIAYVKLLSHVNSYNYDYEYHHYYYTNSDIYKSELFLRLLIVKCAMMLFLAIASTSLTWKSLCRHSRNQYTAHKHYNQVSKIGSKQSVRYFRCLIDF